MRKQRKKLMAEINVVPYIDVMLVLLVIFMITAPLLSQGVNVSLPQASAKPLSSQQKDPIVVSVNATGQYYLNIAQNAAEPIQAADLVARVASEIQMDNQENINRAVLVKGDDAANYGKVVQAMVLLQHAGVADVGLVTQDPIQQNNG